MKCAIIDDESSGREILSELLAAFVPEVTQTEFASSVESGLALLRDYHPDIVFLDVEMGDGTGFDLLTRLEQRNFEVVFITAWQHYAIKAIKAAALDYLLKPVNIDELQSSAQRAHERLQKRKNTGDGRLELLLSELAGKRRQERIALPTINGYEIIKMDDIVYCKSEENYTRFHLLGNKNMLVSKTIKTYEDVLESNGFMRIHKSHIINLSQIQRYLHSKGGEVQMSDGVTLEVSRLRKQALLDKL
ncbi:MAG: LytTR family DNA-binding domain-containing protein [Bacteroidota bacterium]